MSDNREAFAKWWKCDGSGTICHNHKEMAWLSWQAAAEQSSKEIEHLNALVAMQSEALYASKMFIRNGVALGFIRMPDDDCPDPAKDTLPTVENAISASSSTVAKWEAEKLQPLQDEICRLNFKCNDLYDANEYLQKITAMLVKAADDVYSLLESGALPASTPIAILGNALHATQEITESFMREHDAKVRLDGFNLADGLSDAAYENLRVHLEEQIRAANKE